jgi:hypothetical protein
LLVGAAAGIFLLVLALFVFSAGGGLARIGTAQGAATDGATELLFG